MQLFHSIAEFAHYSESLGTYKRLNGYNVNFCVNGWVSSVSVLFYWSTAYSGRLTRYWPCQTFTKGICCSSKAVDCCLTRRNDTTWALHVYDRSGEASSHITAFLFTSNEADICLKLCSLSWECYKSDVTTWDCSHEEQAYTELWECHSKSAHWSFSF